MIDDIMRRRSMKKRLRRKTLRYTFRMKMKEII